MKKYFYAFAFLFISSTVYAEYTPPPNLQTLNKKNNPTYFWCPAGQHISGIFEHCGLTSCTVTGISCS